MNELILSWRKYFGLTQKELAEKSGVSLKSVNYWENGKTKPDVPNIRRVAKALGVEYQEFLAGPDTYHKKKENNKRVSVEKFEPIDPNRASYIYANMRPDLKRSFFVGLSFFHQFDSNPDQLLTILIDEKKLQPLKNVGTVTINIGMKPEPGDKVLVCEKDNDARIIDWTDKTKPEDFEKVWGPIVYKRGRM